jgi:hypothetical protein
MIHLALRIGFGCFIVTASGIYLLQSHALRLETVLILLALGIIYGGIEVYVLKVWKRKS